MTVAALNNADNKQASYLLRQCCTSDAWIDALVAQRPFITIEQLHIAADTHWQKLAEKDYLQAFDGHPKIGDVSSLKAKYANTKLVASGEQSRVEQATDAIIAQLSQGNSDYHEKFGFIFIVCATGKSAKEMSDLLHARLPNNRATEISNAAVEQAKIFHLRIDKLLVDNENSSGEKS
ncbi:MAG: 2-oxo-4-hydroxy-4-carboxy-5-ureidoimidazoline decarboxylase [Colwellia sp.]|nr:2-oxo-4-hydroxy-4-carboxy-5-ureidoimidazoline decarboxylase [Colwellia sp.]